MYFVYSLPWIIDVWVSYVSDGVREQSDDEDVGLTDLVDDRVGHEQERDGDEGTWKSITFK